MTESLVLIPGFLADARVFTDQITDLSRSHAVMVAPLQGDTLTDMADAILAVAPPKFALAGHDLGAALAAEILRRAPGRVGRLALICGSAQPEPPNMAAAREPRMIKAKTGRFGEVLLEELPSTALAESPYRNAIRDHWVDMAMEAGPDIYLAQSRIMQRRPDQQNVLRRARIPTLVIGGEVDTICPPRRQEFIAQLMPRAELLVIKRAGHLPMLEAPQTVSRALRAWLEADAPYVLR
nr:alpha/beta hydrolase [uncultured Celeribacter sp.]